MHLPPQLASLIYLGFTVWLFYRDHRQKANVSSALWIPFFWVAISGSRFISQWMEIIGLNLGSASVEEGSPIDAIFFFGLIGAGVYILYQRRVSLGVFARYNQWVTIYLLLCLVAIFWSDYPLVAFKRWIKLFGQPVMVLLVLTEADPMEAISRLFKRCAYVWIPISMLFIKYYPDLGRGFSFWTGQAENHGITLGKNALGFDCLLLGFFLFWHLCVVWQREKSKERTNELRVTGLLFGLNLWLLNMAQSSTSLVCMLIASMMVIFLGFRFLNLRQITFYLVAGLVVCVLAEVMFGVHDMVIASLGKDPTLTGRTQIWEALLKADINPILGDGFESFWLGDEAKKLNSHFVAVNLNVNEAHNGYLETYLNLGFLGLAITLGFIGATYAKASKALLTDFQFGRFRMAYLLTILIYNWTEAVFRTHSVPFFVFFLIAIDYPRLQLPAADPVLDSEGSAAGFQAGIPRTR